MIKNRSRQGNMLILITAMIFVALAIALFALGYVRLYGSSAEQKTAIEAAALAAARDLSKIVVETDEFGFVGLSDSAPVGADTSAPDNFYLQVHSINSLIGTARLDLIIADELHVNVPEWKILAHQDLARAKSVWNNKLKPTLLSAITDGGSGKDRDGNTISPYVSAENAYRDNQIRMTGSSNYVAKSLQLSLGEVPGVVTNIPAPAPASSDPSLDSSNTAGGHYKSGCNIPFKGTNFVFAGVGNGIRLVDYEKWVPAIPDLPYNMPCIVRAEAVQELNGSSGKHRLKAVACAQPASVFDPTPAPGALVVSFPDGIPDDGPASFPPPPELTLRHLYGPALADNDDDSEFYHSNSGDYPVDTASNIEDDAGWPLTGDPQQKASTCCKLAVYDWLKRGGTKVNVNSVMGIHSLPFNTNFDALNVPASSKWPIQIDAQRQDIPTGTAHLYRFDPDGVIYYDFEAIKPLPFGVVSDDQILVECHDALVNSAREIVIRKMNIGEPYNVDNGVAVLTGNYDLYIRIYGRRPGANKGGQHGGEPLDDRLVSQAKLDKSLRTPGRSEDAKSIIAGYGAKRKGAKGRAVNVGKGALPEIGPREDFMFKYSPSGWDVQRNGLFYRRFASGSGIRKTYQANGIATEIRFRRVIDAKGALQGLLDDGYVVDKEVP